MKRLLFGSTMLIAMATTSASISAQEKGHKAATAQPAPTAAMADKPAATGQAATGDSVALGLLAAINEHEIAAATQAMGKRVSGRVLEYAQMMKKEHSENLAKTKTLGVLSNDTDVQGQKARGAAELKTLSSETGAAYSKAYMDAMVKGHADALDMIDSKLLPAASSAAVKQHLTQTRAHVARHLEAAQAIVAAL
jgi:putative membrane protein